MTTQAPNATDSTPNYPPPSQPPPGAPNANTTDSSTSNYPPPSQPPPSAPNATAADSSTPNYPPPSQPPPSQPPASNAGHRIALSASNPFPAASSLPPTALHDLGGPEHVVYVGSAIFPSSVHPCKIVPALRPPVRVPYGGQEYEHWGRYDLLPISAETMEWVPTGAGKIPVGRRPVEGGFEEDGRPLYHALARMDGVWVPGKTGEHLGAANIPFGGERVVHENYQILCWKA